MHYWMKLFGFPLRVNPIFFIVVALLGSQARDVVLLVSWVVIATAGVLLHEMGHALSVRRFGGRPSIALETLGGLTFWREPLRPGQRLLVAAAGPAVGLAIGLPALFLKRALGLPDGGRAETLLGYVVWVNLGWAIFNMLPMLPMDGGKVMASLFELMFKGGGQRAARIISIGMAVVIGLLALLAKSVYLFLICLLFAWTNVQGMRAERPSADSAPA
ncbi:MAG TPA: site-2 protease family protein [Vicinamibacteria bacterium]|jgi:Zn-dependent protease